VFSALCARTSHDQYANLHTTGAKGDVKAVATLMNQWIYVTGYPCVDVTADNDNDDGKGDAVVLSQKRFLSSGKDDAAAPVWTIPLTSVVGSATVCIVTFICFSVVSVLL
jgi:hypothetical protein